MSYIIDAKRTCIGKFLGQFKKYSASDLGTAVIRELKKNEVPPIEQVIMGQVLTAGCGQNPARQSALGAGLNQDIVASTVNMVCGSGMYSTIIADQMIAAGSSQCIIAGGQESMSNAPFLLEQMRNGKKLGHGRVKDSMITDGLTCAFNDYHMGVTAENIVEKYSFSRREQDEFSLASHALATTAINNGVFKDECIMINKFDIDEQVRPELSIDDLTSLKAVFKTDGTVTAGNASGINDGAAALLLTGKKVIEQGVKPIAEIVGWGMCGIDPAYMGLGPVQSIKNCLRNTGWDINSVDLFECNEAFASQSLAVLKELQIKKEKVNIGGGAIALGHPIGASGARILVTLLHHLKRKKLHRGIAALCIGGGQGIAVALENQT